MSDERKLQWHPAFCDAMELTLREDADVLTFEREYNLGSKPLQVDLLVIRKEGDRKLKGAIGGTLRRHNLFEYKSPGDDLTIDDFYKVTAYGCLYKALSSRHVNEVRASDVTLAMVREERPDALFSALAEEGASATAEQPGIYRLEGNLRFATQVVVTKELPVESGIWLKALTRNLDLAEARRLVVNAVSTKADARGRREVEAILDIATHANRRTFAELRKGDSDMDEAMETIFADRIEEMELRDTKNLMDSMHWSADLAMSALKIAPEKRERYAKLIAADAEKDE